MTKYTDQDKFIVLRGEDGKAIKRVLKGDTPKATIRQAVKSISNNCLDYYLILDDIAKGRPRAVVLPDGRIGEPLVPTLQMSLVASTTLIELIQGKAVAQTEVEKAEASAIIMDQLHAMSDAQLLEIVNAESVRVEPAPSSSEADDEEG